MKKSDAYSALSRLDLNRFSFDSEELSARLSAAEDWGKLVVCHIYLDHILTTALTDHMPNAEAYLESGYKTFADKVALCLALKIIDDEIAGTLKSINKHRNKFAHRLVFDVPDETKISLFKEFSPTRPKEHVLEKDGFANFLLTVVMFLEFERIYTQLLAENSREKALNRERMTDLVMEMFGKLPP